MGAVLNDLRHSLRALRNSPGFAAVTVLLLGLGIGATSALFSVVDGVLLRPLPYRDSERLVMLWNQFTALGFDELPMSEPEFLQYRSQMTTFEAIAAYRIAGYTATGLEQPEHVRAALVSSEIFRILGANARIGRTFAPDEDEPGAETVVLLSDGFWRRTLGGDPQSLGRKLTIDGRDYRVVGVMPPAFDFPEEPDVWLPLVVDAAAPKPREIRQLRTVARLTVGVPIERARAEAAAVASRLQQEYSENYLPEMGWGAAVVPLQEQMVGKVRARLLVLLAAVGFLLLITCANVANLLLARAQNRAREVAVRTALGASRQRLMTQFATETLLLALAGGALGVLLAYAGVAALKFLAPEILPRVEEVQVDAHTLIFALSLALLTGVLLGLLPAFQPRADFAEAFKQAGGRTTASRGRRLARRGLVIAEMAVALVLVVGAVLMAKSFVGLLRVDPGFVAADVLTLRVDLIQAKYPQPPQMAQFFDRAVERLQALPKVEAAGAVSHLPFGGSEWSGSVAIESQPVGPGQMLPEGDFRAVTPGYFQAMRIPLLRGRDFAATDHREATPVAIIDQRLAERYWPEREPLGERIKLGAPEVPTPWTTIVGVVGSVKNQGLEAESRFQVYFPHSQIAAPNMFLVARAEAGAQRLAAPVRQAVRSIDPDLAVYDVQTMEERLSGSLSQSRLSTLLLAAFASVALVLAMLGIYGVIAYSVGERTQELGVRMALGAQRSQVLRLVLRQGLTLTLLGLALGVAAALMLTRWLSSQLYGVSAVDPAAYAGVAVLLCGAALVATYFPARRATRVDPVVALRAE